MPRTLKSNKGQGGYGKRKPGGKKTAGQRQSEGMGRLWRSVIEKRVRQENPRMTEKQIGVEVRRLIAERKKPKPSSYGDYIRFR